MKHLFLVLLLSACGGQVTQDPEPTPECVLVDAPDLIPGGPCVTYVYDCGTHAKSEEACPASSEAGE